MSDGLKGGCTTATAGGGPARTPRAAQPTAAGERGRGDEHGRQAAAAVTATANVADALALWARAAAEHWAGRLNVQDKSQAADGGCFLFSKRTCEVHWDNVSHVAERTLIFTGVRKVEFRRSRGRRPIASGHQRGGSPPPPPSSWLEDDRFRLSYSRRVPLLIAVGVISLLHHTSAAGGRGPIGIALSAWNNRARGGGAAWGCGGAPPRRGRRPPPATGCVARCVRITGSDGPGCLCASRLPSVLLYDGSGGSARAGGGERAAWGLSGAAIF